MVVGRIRDGRRAEIGDVFSCMNRFWGFLWAAIVLVVLIGLASLTIVGGVLLATIWIYVFPFMVDRKMGLTDAMTASYHQVVDNGFWEHLALIVVFFAIGAVANGWVGDHHDALHDRRHRRPRTSSPAARRLIEQPPAPPAPPAATRGRARRHRRPPPGPARSGRRDSSVRAGLVAEAARRSQPTGSAGKTTSKRSHTTGMSGRGERSAARAPARTPPSGRRARRSEPSPSPSAAANSSLTRRRRRPHGDVRMTRAPRRSSP